MKKIMNNEIVNFSEKFNCHHNLIQFYSNIYLNISQLKNKIKLHSSSFFSISIVTEYHQKILKTKFFKFPFALTNVIRVSSFYPKNRISPASKTTSNSRKSTS